MNGLLLTVNCHITVCVDALSTPERGGTSVSDRDDSNRSGHEACSPRFKKKSVGTVIPEFSKIEIQEMSHLVHAYVSEIFFSKPNSKKSVRKRISQSRDSPYLAYKRPGIPFGELSFLTSYIWHNV